MKTIGKKLFVSIALPSLIAALGGVGFAWVRIDRALREATEREALELSELIATSFTFDAQKDAAGAPREAHRAVTYAIRSNATAVRFVSSLRVIGADGSVRWSKKVEEEDRPAPKGAEVLREAVGAAHFIEPERAIVAGRGGEVVYPLGGVACAGCHKGEATMRTGVLHLTLDESSLRNEVTQVFLGTLSGVIVFALCLLVAVIVALRAFLTRPLERLTEAMRRAEAGDFLARATATSNDELGMLARAFNRMLANITSLKASEIDRERDLEAAQRELQLKGELEAAHESLKNRLAELSGLYDVTRALTSTLSLNEVLGRVTELLPTRLDVPKFSIMLVNADNLLEVKAAHPAGQGTEGQTFSIGEGVCGRAAATKKSVYVPDIETAAEFKSRVPNAAVGRGCLLSVPMVHGGELLGVLNLERPEKAGMSGEEIEFFTAVADQASLAVQNARLHEQTVALAITDPLTGVPNRRHLFAQLEIEIARANRFATQLSILMIDIDHFKKLNDNAGHRAGDEVLRHVSHLMRKLVRRVDTVARYGGEEFVVLLPQVTKAEAAEVADKLRLAVEACDLECTRVQPDGRLTVSIGVANLPIDAVNEEQLVDCADSALYASKRGGRNRVTPYAVGMEMHPGRERGPHAQRRRITGEVPVVTSVKG